MGYDLHITRRKHWIDKGDDITAMEWLAYVERDSELRFLSDNGPYFAIWSGQCELDEPWLDWENGQIYTKNPDKALIDKMVTIAHDFEASVQGDDGEIYKSGCQEPVQPRRTSAEHVAAWFARLQPFSLLRFIPGSGPFRAGDKLRDPWGNEHIVIRIERQYGVEALRTRRADGTELSFLLPVNGFFTQVGKD